MTEIVALLMAGMAVLIAVPALVIGTVALALAVLRCPHATATWPAKSWQSIACGKSGGEEVFLKEALEKYDVPKARLGG